MSIARFCKSWHFGNVLLTVREILCLPSANLKGKKHAQADGILFAKKNVLSIFKPMPWEVQSPLFVDCEGFMERLEVRPVE